MCPMRMHSWVAYLQFWLVAICSLMSVPPAAAQSAVWLNQGWIYRVPVTVSNTGAVALSQFQVKVVLGSSFNFSAAKSDGSDLRVTAADGTTLLPFWIESWNPTQTSAIVWTNVPTVPVGNTTLYIYYGNPTATSVASGDSTFDFFDDFSYQTSLLPSLNTAINKAVAWIGRAQDATNSGGVSTHYDTVALAWDPNGYAEVTGYIIPTLYDVAAATTDSTLASSLRNRAVQMANWELSIQSSNGSWVYVFDTGQIIEGLVRAYQETGNSAYLSAATKAGDWLVSMQSANGSWPNDYGGFAKAYHTRVDRALLKLWSVTAVGRYQTAAVNNLNWALQQQTADGWFNNDGIVATENSDPLTHTIAYTIEGFFDSGVMLNNSTYIAAAKKAADALLAQQQPGGPLSGGNYFSDWTPAVSAQVLTGDAQTALMWLKLYNYSVQQGAPNQSYLNAAINMNQYLLTVQGNSSDPGIDGGLAGSDPITGPYNTNYIVPWAAKFFVDDLNLEKNFAGSLLVPALDPSKWSFPSGQAGFSNQGGSLLYNNPSGSFGPLALAMKAGTSFSFTNGVVEYRLQGSGGFDELGLMYRGQNPATSNSYVFYPSIWNSQNTWQLYDLLSGSENFIGRGGTFVPNTWYNVRAAINGSSHSFSINNSLAFATSDATFSSGTLGLLAWGGTIDAVAAFRVRKFASNEPTAAVGVQQAAGPIAAVNLNPSQTAGGNSVTGTVILNSTSGAVVGLASNNTAAAKVPSSVSVPAGSNSANFTVTTFPVTSAVSVLISAMDAGATQNATLVLTPSLSSTALNPQSVVGGNAATGTVTLTGPAPAGGISVTLSSNNTAVATVPVSVLVPQGATTASFTINTSGVASSNQVTISASYSGTLQTAVISVTPASLTSLSISPNPVVGGSPVTATLSMNGAAPQNGAAVTISTNNPALVTIPATVTVNPGANQSTFTVQTSTVSSSTTVSISATYAGVTQSQTLTLNSAGWLSTSWSYRSLVNISNSTGGTLSNFQVRVALDQTFDFSRAQTNGNDLRFTAADGVTLLPYWIESWNPGTSAILWVLVPSIPTSGTSAFLYYGNPSAPAASNGNATFDFFDDFSYTSSGKPALDPTKWSFPAGQAGFSNLGGVLQYSSSTAGFGPRAIAMKNGSSFVFANGIVEYTLSASADYGELGLTYRGSSPETVNSYVFYPSDWNLQDTWLLYAMEGGVATPIQQGGSFLVGPQYKVKAAISGTSHSFSINGTSAVTAMDTNFSSGTLGLLAWGNTTDQVRTFRVRKYASSEPQTTVIGPLAPQSISISPEDLVGGSTGSGTVTLNRPAPSGGAVLSLSSSNSTIAWVPATLSVPAGATNATFTVNTSSVSSISSANVGASLNNISQTALLRVTPPLAAANVVQLENAKQGDPGWQLTNISTNHEIEGYLSLTSVPRGGSIRIFVSTQDPSYTIDIYRAGWYGGAGARRMLPSIQRTGIKQVLPTPDPTTGMVECNWANPYVLNIPLDTADSTDWASGIYLVNLTGSSGLQAELIFVVRDDQRTSTYLFQSSVNTFEAYNNWGGKSLYAFNSTGPQAVKVSFNRPYVNGGPSDFLVWEYNMVRFLEREGYDVTYATDVDTHENPNLLLSHKEFVVAGHDEYWSWQMRNNVEAARDKGVSIGFFSANVCYWQIRYETSPLTGAADRTIVAYKETALSSDPFVNTSQSYLTTTEWRLSPVNRPEDAMVGVMYGTEPVNGDIVVSNASNWIYSFTGLSNGSVLSGMQGYEVDWEQGDQPANTVVVAHSPVSGTSFSSDTTVYTATSGATVFATGSIQWSWGLDNWGAPSQHGFLENPAAKEVTRNVLARSVGAALTPYSSISISPGSQSIALGSSSSQTITLAPLAYNPTYTFDVSGLPAGATASFAPATVVGSGSTTLTVTTSSTTPHGTYNITIDVNDGTQTRSNVIALTM